METIYLSLSAQVAVGTFFMKSPVVEVNLVCIVVVVQFYFYIFNMFPCMQFFLIYLLLLSSPWWQVQAFWLAGTFEISWSESRELLFSGSPRRGCAAAALLRFRSSWYLKKQRCLLQILNLKDLINFSWRRGKLKKC